MILVTLRELARRPSAQEAAIRQYRAAAAFHRTLAEEIAAGCDHRGVCYPVCIEAADHRRRARRCESAAWLEEHPAPVRRSA